MPHESEPTPAPDQPRYRFRKQQHLRRPAEFQRVYDGKQRAGDELLLVFGARNQVGLTRIGLSVSRKHGGSVQRQRLKRLLREAFRLSQDAIPSGLDLILIPRVGAGAGVAEFRQSLERLSKKLDKRVVALQAPAADLKDRVEGPSGTGGAT